MKTIFKITILLSLFFSLVSCNSVKNKNTMKFTIVKINNEKDGQTLFLENNKGEKFTTIISLANRNFVDVEVGNNISLVAKELLESYPVQIISTDIKVISKK